MLHQRMLKSGRQFSHAESLSRHDAPSDLVTLPAATAHTTTDVSEMSQNLAELLQLLVEDFFGEVASCVFVVLLRHGRLSISSLLHFSALPLRIAKPGLVTLIQQHLVYHHVGVDGIPYYEANLDSAYMWARAGKILDIIEERFGGAGEEVARAIMSEGHATVTELAEAYGLRDDDAEHLGQPHTNGTDLVNGANGQNHNRQPGGRQIHSYRQLQHLLQQMKRAGYLVAVTTKSYLSPADAEIQAALRARGGLPATKAPNGKKQREEMSRATNTLKRRWRDREVESERSDDDSDGPPTKVTRTNGMTNGVNGSNRRHHGSNQRDQVVLKLNHDKVNVALRVRNLTDLAARYVGETSSQVYRALLETMAERQPRCFETIIGPGADDDPDDEDDEDDKLYNPIVAAMELLDKLPSDFDLSRGIATRPRPQAHETNGEGTTNGDPFATNDIHDDDDHAGESDILLLSRNDGDDRHRTQQIARHLDILANSTINFCKRVGTQAGGQYKVNFSQLCLRLTQLDIEDAVTSRFGNEATRIIRILDAKGKLDDRQLGVISLQRAKDVKMLLLELQTAGFVDLQEVPRDAGRAPQRTIYMYFYERDRVRRKMLDDTYKIMSRLLQRARVERDKVRLVIEKAERTDVQGNEEKYLSGGELQELRNWQEREERLLLAFSRCDDVVANLRDFLPESESV